MANGGIGGVHRGFAEGLNISGDLPIAATQVMVVCSGAKSILDVGATSELLERPGTRRAAGTPRHCRCSTPRTAAPPSRLWCPRRPRRPASPPRTGSWPAQSGLLLARPPVDGLDLEALVAEAVDQVASEGITGQAVTPTILTRVEELSGGRSIEVNQRLIADNATLAAEVAVAYAELPAARQGK